MQKENNIPVTEAAKAMNISPQCLRIALREGKVPFGFAVRISGEIFTYHISPYKFKEYMGFLPGEKEIKK